MKSLLHEAGKLGAHVSLQHFDDPDLLGYYDRERREIVLRLGMTVRETRCVMAHELCHALMDDECSDGPEERRADRMAAAMLIGPEAYARAERINPDPHAVADELDVTVDVVHDYRTYCLQRLGQRTYGRSQSLGLHGARARHLST